MHCVRHSYCTTRSACIKRKLLCCGGGTDDVAEAEVAEAANLSAYSMGHSLKTHRNVYTHSDVQDLINDAVSGWKEIRMVETLSFSENFFTFIL